MHVTVLWVIDEPDIPVSKIRFPRTVLLLINTSRTVGRLAAGAVRITQPCKSPVAFSTTAFMLDNPSNHVAEVNKLHT